MARTKVSAKKSTGGGTTAVKKGSGPRKPPPQLGAEERKRKREEEEAQEEREASSSEGRHQHEHKRMATPARRCMQILQEGGDEAAEGSLDEEIIEIWENKIHPQMSQSQISGVSEPPADNQGILRLANKIKSVPEQELLGYINKQVAIEADLQQFMRALFQGLPSHTEKGKTLRAAVLQRLMWLIIKGQLSGKKAEEAVNVMLPEMDAIPDEEFIDLVEVIVWGIEKARSGEGSFLAFLPKTIAAIERLPAVGVDEFTNKTGPQYRSHLIERMCRLDWPDQLITQITATLREIPLSQDDLHRVAQKIVSFFKDIQINELPSLIYQLILLANKGSNDVKTTLLRGIAHHLENLGKEYDQEEAENRTATSSGNERMLRHVEGTVLLHLQFAIKQDQELGRAFLKVFKSGNLPLTSFTVALLLSVARIQRFADTALETIKTAIQAYYKEQQKKSKSYWMEKMRQHMSPTIKLDEAILATIKHSAYGWDHITPSLVQLGIMMMDSVSALSPASSLNPGSASASLSSSGIIATSAPSTSPTSTSSSTKMLLRLGVRILCETFKVHASVRSEILEQILSRVMISGESSNVLQYVILLSSICRECQDLLLGGGGEYLPRIKEVFDYLSYVPPTVTRALLAAVEPIMAINPTFQDHIILVLRKAMFSRELESRLTAVAGFEHLLKSCSRKKGKSEAQKAELFSLEMIGFLRRCLGQQWEIRARLYDALIEIFKSSHSLAVKEAVAELLLQHLNNFVDYGPSASVPIKLDKCVEISTTSAATVKRVEPFGNLLNAVQRCVVSFKADQAKQQDSPEVLSDPPLMILKELESSLDTLVEKLMKKELEDFHLDKSADYSDVTCEGRFHQEAALLLLSTWEVLINYSVMKEMPEPPSTAALRGAIELFTQYENLQNVVKEATTKKKGKGKTKGTKEGSTPKGKEKASKGKEKENEDDEAAKPKKRAARPQASGAVWSKRHRLVEGTFLEVSCVLGLISLLADEASQSADSNEVQQLIRNHPAFQTYFFAAAYNMLNSWNEEVQAGFALDMGDRRTALLRSRSAFCSKVSTATLGDYVSQHLRVLDVKNKKIAQAQLECLEQSLRLLVSQWGPKKVATHFKDFLLPQLTDYQDTGSEVAEEEGKPIDPETIIHNMIVRLEGVMLGIVKSKRYKEAEAFKDIIELLFEFLRSPRSLKELVPLHAKWMDSACAETTTENSSAAKSMVSLFLRIARSLPKATILGALAKDVHVLLGHIWAEDPSNQTRRYPLLNKATVSQVMPLLTAAVDGLLEEAEQVLIVSKNMYLDDKEQDQRYDDSQDEENGQASVTMLARLLMDECCKRIHAMLDVLTYLVTSAFPFVCAEALVKTLVHLYKILTLLAKTGMQLQLRPSEQFQRLVERSGKEFTPTIYDLISYIENPKNQDEGSDKDKLTKAKHKRLATLLPNLIFLIEQFESVLIRYGKKFKINLLKGFHRSTARDFRIMSSNLKKPQEMPPPPPQATAAVRAAAKVGRGNSAPKAARAAGLKRKKGQE